MIHQFFIVGQIKKIQVSEPKDPKKNPSAVLLVQYGATREQSGGAVEFINAVMVRVPNYRYPAIKDSLQVGAVIEIKGHVQGVYKTAIDEGFFTVELVADQIAPADFSYLPTGSEE